MAPHREPLNGPPSAPPGSPIAEEFRYEARVWREGTVSEAGHLTAADWATIAWCPAVDYAQLVVESAMVRYECRHGEIFGPSPNGSGDQMLLFRYDQD